MKKIITILIACVTLNACSSSNEIDNPFVGKLFNTVWLGIGDDEGESYTFISDSDFKYVGEGTIASGTYTFDGTNGKLTTSSSNFTFKIEGTKMTVEDGSSSVFIKN
jgi:major membrane immunogen (membrane-anchored lipoprotein)